MVDAVGIGNDQGRPVYVVPGRIDSPESEGCHSLIRDGAQLVTSVDDILADLNYLPGTLEKAVQTTAFSSKNEIPMAGTQAIVWDYLTRYHSACVDSMSEALSVPVAEVARAGPQ